MVVILFSKENDFQSDALLPVCKNSNCNGFRCKTV